MIGRPKFVLASGSPRRLSLINQAGIDPDALRPCELDETPKKGELPRACANRLARAKAEAAFEAVRNDEDLQGAFILAADTVVAVGRRILPKAADDEEVCACLKLLSGRRHQVITAVALVTPDGKLRLRVAQTRVSLLKLSEAQIRAYVESREGVGKAGGYAIQGRAEALIKEISGSYSNVVGLPLALTVGLLQGCGYG